MIVTLNLSERLVAQLARTAAERGVPADGIAEEMLERGFSAAPATPREPFKLKGYDLGVLPGVDPERLSEIAQEVEDDEKLAHMGRQDEAERTRLAS